MEHDVHIVDSVAMTDPTDPRRPPSDEEVRRKLHAHIEQLDREARRRLLEAAAQDKDEDHA